MMNLFYDLMMLIKPQHSFAGKKDEKDVAHFHIYVMRGTRSGSDIDRPGPKLLSI
jgi:hypothetical protein